MSTSRPLDLDLVRGAPAARRIIRAWRRLCTPEGSRRAGSGEDTVIACSGGADSVALALCLAASRSSGRSPALVVAHVLHDLRPVGEAEADRDFVRHFAASLGLRYAEGRASRGSAGVSNAEAAARALRYRELARIAREHGAGFVATAHHADDQFESLLMALLRGAGPRGMRGVAPSRSISPEHRDVRLIRPMLRVCRADAEQICTLAGVSWREDRTNQERTRLRAALRHDVIPLLRDLRPQAAQRAVTTAGLMRQTTELIDREGARLLAAASASDVALAWPRRTLAAEPPLLVGEAIRGAARRLAGAAGLDRLTHRALQPVIRAVCDGSTDPRRFDLHGMTVVVTAHTVTASKAAA